MRRAWRYALRGLACVVIGTVVGLSVSFAMYFYKPSAAEWQGEEVTGNVQDACKRLDLPGDRTYSRVTLSRRLGMSYYVAMKKSGSQFDTTRYYEVSMDSIYEIGFPARLARGYEFAITVRQADGGGTTHTRRKDHIRIVAPPAQPLVMKWRGARVPYERYLPTRIIWSGLALDVVTWSVTVAICYHVALRTRASLRRRRNLCPACAYSLASLTSTMTACSECGKAVRPNPDRAPPSIGETRGPVPANDPAA